MDMLKKAKEAKKYADLIITYNKQLNEIQKLKNNNITPILNIMGVDDVEITISTDRKMLEYLYQSILTKLLDTQELLKNLFKCEIIAEYKY